MAADHPRLPSRWSATENVRWKVELDGRGWSSPIVWGRRVFLTSAITGTPLEDPRKGLYFGGNREEPPETEVRWIVTSLDPTPERAHSTTKDSPVNGTSVSVTRLLSDS